MSAGRALPDGREVVLVSDGEERVALAAVRALAARGHSVFVLSKSAGSLAGRSRHAHGEHVLGDAARDPAGWTERLGATARTTGAGWILPLTEVSLGTLYAHGPPDQCRLMGPPHAAYEQAIDKHRLLERASSLGLRVPRTRLVEQPEALTALPDGFTYPVVVKPRRSRVLQGGVWRAGGIHLVRDAAGLARAAADDSLTGGALLQEFIPGHGEAVFLLCDAGRPLLRFAHRRIREKPPTGGVSVVRESIPPDPLLLAQSERLLADLGWSGVAMVEFRRSPDGTAALMEINPRLWGSLQLAIDSGADFPGLLLDLHRGVRVEPGIVRTGVRTRWLLGDLDHLLTSWRSREVREVTGVGHARLVRGFSRSFFDGSHLEVFRWTDPGPFLHELAEWLRHLRGARTER